MDFVPLIQNLGLPAALVVFFVWWSHTREKRMGERLDEIQNYVRTDLARMAADGVKAQTLCASAHDSNTRALVKLNEASDRYVRSTEMLAAQVGRIQCLQTPPHGVPRVHRQGD